MSARSTLPVSPPEVLGASPVSTFVGIHGWMLFAVAALAPVARGISGTFSDFWTGTALVVIGGAIVVGRVQFARPVLPQLAIGFGLLATLVTAVPQAGRSSAVLLTVATMLVAMAIGPAVMTWFARHRPAALRVTLTGLLIGQAVNSAVALVQSVGVSVLGQSANLGRSPGLAGHPNTLGFLAAIAVMVHLAGVRSGRRRAMHVVGIALSVGALAVSGSTSSMLALGVGLLFFAIAIRLRVTHAIGIVIAALVLLIGASIVATETGLFRSPLDRVAQVTGQTDQISSVGERMQTIQFAIAHILQSPLVGAGMDDVSGGTYDGTTVTHNLLVRLWFQGGLGGLIVALALVVLWVGLLAKGLRTPQLALPTAGLAVFITFSMTAATFQQLYYWLPAMVFSGLILASRPSEPWHRPASG